MREFILGVVEGWSFFFKMVEEIVMLIELFRMWNWVMIFWVDVRGGCKWLCGVGNKRGRYIVIFDGIFEVDKYCCFVGWYVKFKVNEG